MPAMNLKVAEIRGFGEMDGGARSCVSVADQSGVEVVIAVPHHMEGQFLAAFTSGCGTAAKIRGGTIDPGVLHALRVENILFAPADNGELGLRIELPAGLALNLALDANQARALRQTLEKIEQNIRLGGSTRAQ